MTRWSAFCRVYFLQREPAGADRQRRPQGLPRAGGPPDITGISPEHIYCVGDNDNDLPMLRVAKIGFVPEGSVAAGRDERLQLVRDADHGCVENVIRLLEWRYRN